MSPQALGALAGGCICTINPGSFHSFLLSFPMSSLPLLPHRCWGWQGEQHRLQLHLRMKPECTGDIPPSPPHVLPPARPHWKSQDQPDKAGRVSSGLESPFSFQLG